jgi:DNA-binding protein HU-beta
MATKTKAKKTSRRTTHRSSKGTKLYAVRAADGTFKDIQTYKRAHAADLRRKSKSETAKAKTGARKKKAATKKKAAKKK